VWRGGGFGALGTLDAGFARDVLEGFAGFGVFFGMRDSLVDFEGVAAGFHRKPN
jgi:hypothetical protein